MPKPYVFSSRHELVARLRSPELTTLAANFFAQRCGSVKDVVHQGVGPNTFRAFHHIPKPSVIFRTWTTQHVSEELNHLLACADAASYSQLVDRSTQALEALWRATTNKEMGYGRGSKLLNLAFKKLACYEAFTHHQRQKLISLMHVPWDSYTIQGLRQVFPELRIRGDSTMRFISSPGQYQAFQFAIQSVCDEAGVPAIHYDILAWDQSHQD